MAIHCPWSVRTAYIDKVIVAQADQKQNMPKPVNLRLSVFFFFKCVTFLDIYSLSIKNCYIAKHQKPLLTRFQVQNFLYVTA